MDWDSSVGGAEIFRTRPDGPWGPLCLLYNGYRVSFPDYLCPSSVEVKEREDLYLYSSFGASWLVVR